MIDPTIRTLMPAIAVAVLAAASYAAPPYSEDFSAGTAGWRFTTANAAPLTAVGAGGPDGGAFIRNNLATLAGSVQAPNTLLLFRAQQTYAGLNLGYTGDWITAGVKQVSAFVRHNAPQSLEFTGRFTPAANNPAGFYVTPTTISPGAWTQVFFDVTAASPQLVTYEGGDYQSVFQGFQNEGIANMQFGVTIPNSLLNTGPYVFDFDKLNITLTPESGARLLAACGIAGVLGVARRRVSLRGA
jgi:hypothetical protein